MKINIILIVVSLFFLAACTIHQVDNALYIAALEESKIYSSKDININSLPNNTRLELALNDPEIGFLPKEIKDVLSGIFVIIGAIIGAVISYSTTKHIEKKKEKKEKELNESIRLLVTYELERQKDLLTEIAKKQLNFDKDCYKISDKEDLSKLKINLKNSEILYYSNMSIERKAEVFKSESLKVLETVDDNFGNYIYKINEQLNRKTPMLINKEETDFLLGQIQSAINKVK